MTDESATTSEQREELEPKAPKAKKPRSKKAATSKKTAAKKPVLLTAKQIFDINDIREEELYLKDWEGSLFIRGLSSVDHEKLVQSSMDGPLGARQFNMVGYQAKLAILCCFDGSTENGGKRIFADEHYSMLKEKASGPIGLIAAKAQELSGIGQAALEKLKENLGLTPNADSAFG